MKLNDALILAAGAGKRLWPFTETLPKPLVKVGDKSIIGMLVSHVESIGLTPHIVVRESHLSLFRKELGDRNFIVRKEGRGTAASVKMGSSLGRPFLVLSGDHVMDYSIIDDLVDCWDGTNTVAVRYSNEAHRFGVISSYCGKVVGVKEKPPDVEEGFINMGMYVVLPSLIPKLSELRPSPRGELEFTDVLDGFSLFSTVKPWMDVASPWNLLEAFSFLYRNKAEVRGKIGDKAELISPVYVGEGCKIGDAYIRNSYIGPNTVIEDGAVVEDSYLQGNCSIGEGAVVKSSFLAEGSSVGKGKETPLKFYEEIDLNGKTVRANRELGAFLPPGATL